MVTTLAYRHERDRASQGVSDQNWTDQMGIGDRIDHRLGSEIKRELAFLQQGTTMARQVDR